MLKLEDNTKALFRLGDSYFQTEKFDDALIYLAKANKNTPNDLKIKALLKETKEKIAWEEKFFVKKSPTKI